MPLAKSNLNQALKWAKLRNNTEQQYKTLLTLGILSKGDNHKALQYLQQAEQLMPSVLYPEADNLKLMADIYAQTGNYTKSIDYYHKALKITTKGNGNLNLLTLYTRLIQTYTHTGQYKEALECQQARQHLADSILNAKVMVNVNELDVKYQTAEKDKQLVLAQKQLVRRNYLIGTTTGGVILISGLFFFFYRSTRHKQKVQQQEKEIDQLKAAMHGEERERMRIARELHDGIMVRLSSVKMNLNTLQKKMKDNEHAPQLKQAMGMLDNATQELRRSAHNLMPDLLLAEGLEGALDYFCSSLSSDSGTTIEFQHYGSVPELPSDYQLLLYRIVQELVQNALKHAEARHIIVQMDVTEKLLTITVEDDGQGIDPEAPKTGKGSGLNSIRSRIQALNGSLDLQTKKGVGTTVYIELEIAILQAEKNKIHAHNRSHS